MKLFSTFEQVLNQYSATPRQIILALSGGVDSRVMLDLLAIYRDIHPEHRYLVLHVHHGLSPFANKWLSQCQAWSEALNFDFKGLRVQVKNHGQGIEFAAREARYQAILSQAQDKALLLTGHHADDQAETFLLALKRGSGVAGLAAMPSIRKLEHIEILRPLLHVYRADIERYALEQGLSWVEDDSNDDTRFDRNFVRQKWLPLAKTRWPSLVKSINRSAAFCAEQQALLDELLVAHDHKIRQPDGSICLPSLSEYSNNMQVALLRRWLKQQAKLSLSQVQLQQVFSSIIEAAEDANPIMQFADFQLRRYKQSLHLLPRLMDVSHWQHQLDFAQPLILPNGTGSLELSSYRGMVGLGLARPKPDTAITVSFDPQGLVAHPLGRQGKRKLKKLFQEYGVPSWQRKRTPLIFYGEQLAAVADLFVCQGFEGQDCELMWYKPSN